MLVVVLGVGTLTACSTSGGSSPPGTRRSGRCRWARTASSRSSTSPTRRASTPPPRRIHSRGRTRSSGTAGTRRRSPAPCSCRAWRAGSWRGPTHARPPCPTPGTSCPCGTSTSPPRGSSLPRGRYRRTRPVSSTPSTGPSRAGCGCGTRAPSCRVAGWRSPAVTWSAPPVSSRNATGGPPCSPPPSAVHRTRSSQSTSRSARWSRASTTATAPRSPSSPWRTESRPARASPSRNRCSASAIWRGWRRTRPACATSVRARACPAASTKARWPRDCSGSRRPSTGTTPAGRSSR